MYSITVNYIYLIMGPRVPRKDPGLSPVNSGGYSVVSQTLYVKGGAVRSSDIEALTCGICLKILREPIQIIICGCRFCNACMEGLTKLNPRYITSLVTILEYTDNVLYLLIIIHFIFIGVVQHWRLLLVLSMENPSLKMK